MENKRRDARMIFREPIRYHLKNSDQDTNPDTCFTGAGLSCDLSQSGIRIRSTDFLPLSADIFMDFFLKQERPVQAQGRVVWVQKQPHSEYYQIGVRFSPALPKSPEFLQAFERSF